MKTSRASRATTMYRVPGAVGQAVGREVRLQEAAVRLGGDHRRHDLERHVEARVDPRRSHERRRRVRDAAQQQLADDVLRPRRGPTCTRS
jgi:hypothetical protein